MMQHNAGCKKHDVFGTEKYSQRAMRKLNVFSNNGSVASILRFYSRQETLNNDIYATLMQTRTQRSDCVRVHQPEPASPLLFPEFSTELLTGFSPSCFIQSQSATVSPSHRLLSHRGALKHSSLPRLSARRRRLFKASSPSMDKPLKPHYVISAQLMFSLQSSSSRVLALHTVINKSCKI